MRLARFLKNLPINKKFLVYFCTLSLIPILILGGVSYFISYNISKENAIDYSEVIVHESTGELDDFLNGVKKVAMMAVKEPSIQESLRNPLSKDTLDRYNEELKLNDRLQFIEGFYDNIDGIYVIGENGSKYKSSYRITKDGNLTKTDQYKEVVSQEGMVWFPTNENSSLIKNNGHLTLMGGLRIRDSQSGYISGVVFINIQEPVISEFVHPELGKSGFMYIVDENNKIITHPNKDLISKNDEMNNLSGSNRGNFILIREKSSVTGWYVIGVIPISELTKESEFIRGIIIIILLLVCFFAAIFAIFIYHNTVIPIKEMTRLMKRVEDGDLQVSMPSKYKDEIGQLSNGFSLMIKRLKESMDNVYKEQEALRKAEIKSLQYQINPHFLYNTLDSIVWLARANKNKEVISMIIAITKLFRIGLSRGNDIITIKEEVDHVTSYLSIQKMRYSKKLEYEIDIPENIMNYQVVKVILQPLIENAIYHGIKLKREKGIISITAKEDIDKITFIVKDTGIGMTEEKLTMVNDGLQGKTESMSIYGIKNVNERLKLCYGDNYGLHYSSVYQEGTTVEVIIPKV